ncbi:histidinol phosphate phosphatase HisJ family [Desulfurispirillum indicum S5]|uniref:Histidinol-phosphatase n=1 Tax=Desulfurispirillum indicum (strain ATCC BAA-1389 / DSM 22839 / S5) TaxID=653733 RepID=E6W6K9_DESIS|nr:histidinol-phosphatase HisJ [Desulfurispirillum indicum]ADU65009.1 histidinol phosphate phosphatase HisJ family [Desulfurispirillum indicum S5]
MHDRHVHSVFCLHGSGRRTEDILLERIEAGASRVTFTEHAPLPPGFDDPSPLRDSSMAMEKLMEYRAEILELRARYAGKCDVRCGLEVDYIEGYEEPIRQFLDQYGELFEDSLLSVHFLHGSCVDFSPEEFERLLSEQYQGDLEALYRDYYRVVALAARWDGGAHKPRRFGHLDLVKKFRDQFPLEPDKANALAIAILPDIAAGGMGIEVNTGGLKKPCREIYPAQPVLEAAKALGIALSYGSDTH